MQRCGTVARRAKPDEAAVRPTERHYALDHTRRAYLIALTILIAGVHRARRLPGPGPVSRGQGEGEGEAATCASIGSRISRPQSRVNKRRASACQHAPATRPDKRGGRREGRGEERDRAYA
jgi:hypothetical protein